MNADPNKPSATDSEPTSKADVSGTPETHLTEAAATAERAGKDIAATFRSLAPRQRRSVVTVFRRQLFPPGKPGRKRSKEITAAYADWKAGMRGLSLYRKHILRFDRMGYWERKVKTRALMDSIRARTRREQTQQTPAIRFRSDQVPE
jgi:hypothetical protein